MPAWLGLLQLLTVGAVGFLILLIIYTAWSLLHPSKRTYAWALHRGLPADPSELDQPLEFETLTINSNSQTLQGWKIKAHNPTGPRLLLVHGWGSSSIGALKRIPHLSNLASEIITLDLPGHGESSGTAQMGTSEHNDLNILLDSLDNSKPTIVYGWSMGAGIALRFARDFGQTHHVQAVIAESVYTHAITPARNVIRLRGLPTRLNLRPAIALIGILKGVGPTWKGFARDHIAQDLQVPVLFIHGSTDPVSPLQDAKDIQAAAPNATLLEIQNAGHNNIWTVPEFTEQSLAGVHAVISGKRKKQFDSLRSIIQRNFSFLITEFQFVESEYAPGKTSSKSCAFRYQSKADPSLSIVVGTWFPDFIIEMFVELSDEDESQTNESYDTEEINAALNGPQSQKLLNRSCYSYDEKIFDEVLRQRAELLSRFLESSRDQSSMIFDTLRQNRSRNLERYASEQHNRRVHQAAERAWNQNEFGKYLKEINRLTVSPNATDQKRIYIAMKKYGKS